MATRRDVHLPRLSEDEAGALYALLLDLVDGREDYPDEAMLRSGHGPPGWRALVRILDRLEQL